MRLMNDDVVEFLRREAYPQDEKSDFLNGRGDLAREILNMMEIPYEREEDKKER